MSKKIALPNNGPSTGYNTQAYIHIVREKFGILRARLFNLADTSSVSKEQAEAMKGLIKDFSNDAYYKIVHDLTHFLSSLKIIDDQCSSGPMPMIDEDPRM